MQHWSFYRASFERVSNADSNSSSMEPSFQPCWKPARSLTDAMALAGGSIDFTRNNPSYSSALAQLGCTHLKPQALAEAIQQLVGMPGRASHLRC